MPSSESEHFQHYIDRLSPLIDHVRANPRRDLSVGALARAVHFSPYHFHRLFTAVMGETVAAFVRRVRLERAVQLMKASPRRALSGVAGEAGFNSLSDFSRAFRRHYGMAPSRWDRRSPLNASACTDAPRDDIEAPSNDLRAMIASDEAPLGEPRLREFPGVSLAYVRIRRPFDPGALTRGYRLLRQWLHQQGLSERCLLGLSWDDVEVTPMDRIRYDISCTIPRGTRGRKEIGVRELPPLVVVALRATGRLAHVARAWDYLYHEWLPRSRFEPYNLPAFEWHHGWPETLDADDWDLDCCIPLKSLEDFPQDLSSRSGG